MEWKNEIRTKFPPNHIEHHSIILDSYDEWKVFKKKNVWKKLYNKQTYKEGVIDSYCASFSNIVDSIVSYDGDDERIKLNNAVKYRQFLVDADTIARSFAASSVEFIEGWKIHKDWFRCMLVQLLTHNASVYDDNNIHEAISGLFVDIGFGDYKQYQNPKYDDITSIYKIAYMFKTPENGTIKRHYTVVIEPTSPIPCGSEWVAKSGVIWKAGLPFENGLIDFVTAGHEDGSAVKDMVRHFHPNQVHGMKRVK